jgi:hypothetical protein
MSQSIHNPDTYMAGLRQIVAQGRKRIGFLVGAGAPAGMRSADESGPLIPAVAGLTTQVLAALRPSYGSTLDQLCTALGSSNIEALLSRTRTLSGVIGSSQVHGQDGAGFQALSDAICHEIGKIVGVDLPPGPNAYVDLVNWISGADRQHPVEIFTTNYDLLFEQAFERAKVPYFDGFAGGHEPFFDPSSISNNDLPPRWVRLWKLHGSLGWETTSRGEIARTGRKTAAHLVFPEHLKYDLVQKAPYAALFDRLQQFLLAPDTLLIATGFSFADAHISARVAECLSANPSASVFAFQFGALEQGTCAADLAARRPNMSVYAQDGAIINGIRADWLPGAPPMRDWGPVQATFWGDSDGTGQSRFLLGSFDKLARFFAASRATVALQPVPQEPDVVADAPLTPAT